MHGYLEIFYAYVRYNVMTNNELIAMKLIFTSYIRNHITIIESS